VYCHKCERPIPDNSVFCLQCGASQPVTKGKRSVLEPGRAEGGSLGWLWFLLSSLLLAGVVWYYRPVAQTRYREWKASHNCSVPSPGSYVYVRKADFDSLAAVTMAAEFQERGIAAMCGNLYGNSATLVGPYADLKAANAAFWRLHLTREPGDYIRLLNVDASAGGTWSDPVPPAAGSNPKR
jgi:hypothetical protein